MPPSSADKSSADKPTVVDGISGAISPSSPEAVVAEAADAQAQLPAVKPAAARAGQAYAYETGDSDEVEMLDELLGETLHDTYLLNGLLGEGGMSRVYEGHHTRIEGKRFAVKVLRADMSGHGEVARRFRREARAVASVIHPNVVDIFDVGETPDGRPYLVTELLVGESLGDRLDRETKLPVALAAQVLRGICAGVKAAHDRGIIHRDLKPDNVFLAGDPTNPEVKVLDFGLARLMDTEDSNLTRTGVVMGTPGYMSPEQARGERVDFRTDIYGAGAILYAALTGRAPYERETFQMTVLAVMHGDPLRPRAIEPQIPATLEVMIQRAMAREPSERFASLDEFSMALERFDSSAFINAATAVGPPRAPHISQLALAEESTAAESARAQFLVLCLVGLLVSSAALATAVISALELFVFERSATGVELALVTLAILGTTATPAMLAFGRVKKRIWNNSARVLELLGSIRTVLVSGAAAYGLAAIVVRIHDGLVARGEPVLIRTLATGWAGWSSIFFLVAAVVGLAALVRRLSIRPNAGWLRRLLVGPLLGLLALGATLGLLKIGFGLGGQAARAVTADLQREPGSVAPLVVSSGAPSVTASVNSEPDAGAPSLGKTASASELGAAKAKGLAGLLPLRTRYPEDPDVLRPLALALGEDKRTHGDAVTALKQLFRLVPKDTSDRQLRTLVIRIAASGGGAAEPALELMSQGMGEAGPDLLYDLFLTSTALRPRITRLFDDQALRNNASPALSIAYDLRSADSCAARVSLLDRARKQGDERSIATLQMLSSRTKKGCGAGKRKPCPAPCAAQAKAFIAATTDMRARLEKEQQAVEAQPDTGGADTSGADAGVVN